VYQEELKQKGGHTTYENAAREAFEEAGNTIAGKLLEWVK
jgi:8-oxo-dGTP pyrophosphatase MutT (NUDIX family)